MWQNLVKIYGRLPQHGFKITTGLQLVRLVGLFSKGMVRVMVMVSSVLWLDVSLFGNPQFFC